MVINLEITFIVNFIINSTLITMSSYLIGKKFSYKIILFSLLYSISSIMVLYINSYILFIIVKIILVLLFPLIIILNSRIKNIFIIFSCFLLLCGISGILSQYYKLSFISALCIVLVFIVFSGFIPKLLYMNKQKLNNINIKINNHSIKAFIDTGLLLPSVINDEVNIIIDETIAKKILDKNQYINLIMNKNIVDYTTTSNSNNKMSWIYVNDIFILKKFKYIKLDSKVYLSNVHLPFEALISNLNI